MDYNTLKFLNLEGIDINLFKSPLTKINTVLECTILLNQKGEVCPMCGSISHTINDYKLKTITHSISTRNPCILKYKTRKYINKACNSTFYEKTPSCQKDKKESLYTKIIFLEKLKSHTSTFSSVAKDFNISIQGVINIFDKYVSASRLKLPSLFLLMKYIQTSILIKNILVFFMIF